MFAGQFCMTGSRWLVQKGIGDRFRGPMAERVRAIKVGPASDPSSDMSGLAAVDDFIECKHVTLSQGVMFLPED